jgi:hypothetical protein
MSGRGDSGNLMGSIALPSPQFGVIQKGFDKMVGKSIKIEVYEDGWTGGLQLSIGDENGGYRLAGPKFNGSGKCLLSKTLDARDVEEIRSYIDKV